MINLSASKVDCFFGCEYLYKMRYIDKPIIQQDNKYFLIGNIAHKTLELFYSRNFHKQAGDFTSNLSSCLKEAYTKYDVFSLVKKNVICKQDIKNIKNMMKSYIKNVIPTYTPNIVYIEEAFHITIDDFMIAGKADRVDVRDEGYFIVDYKTNSKAFSKKDINDSVQLPTYKIWLNKVYGKDIKVYGEYVYLKLTDGKKWKSTFEITEDHVSAALDKYRHVQKHLLNNTREFKRNLNYKYCGPMCDYFALCRKGDN